MPSLNTVVVAFSIGKPLLSKTEYVLPMMSSTLATTPCLGLNVILFALGDNAIILPTREVGRERRRERDTERERERVGDGKGGKTHGRDEMRVERGRGVSYLVSNLRGEAEEKLFEASPRGRGRERERGRQRQRQR